MKYVSLDIETTGLDAQLDQILEVGAIIEDTNNPKAREDCPQFHVYVDNERLSGNTFALSMNANILKKILELKKAKDTVNLVNTGGVISGLVSFLKQNGIEKATFAGKNFAAFDLQFLKKMYGYSDLKLHHRFLDPTVFFTDFNTDEILPDLTLCKTRAGIKGTVTHEALDDAWDVIELLRKKYVSV